MTLPSEITPTAPVLSHTQWAEDPAAALGAANARLRKYTLRQQKALFIAELSLQHNFDAIVAPVVGDDSGSGYVMDSLWVDYVADKSYRCTDASVGAAVWLETTTEGIAHPPAAGGGGSVDFFMAVGKGPGAATVTNLFGQFPFAGTFVSAGFVGQKGTTSDASNHWGIMPQNKTNANADLLAAPYNTNSDGELVKGVEKNLGAAHATPANLVINAGDVIELVFTGTGAPTSFFNDIVWVRVTVTPS